MFSKKIKKIICLALILCILLITTSANATNTIPLMWAKHQNTYWNSLYTMALYILHCQATVILQTDNDGAGTGDVSVDVVLEIWDSIVMDFTYPSGDDTVNGISEITNCIAKMGEIPVRDAVMVTSIWYNGQYIGGYNLNSHILLPLNLACSVGLAHEVGHICGIPGDYSPGIPGRIMNAVISGNETFVDTSERNEYQGGIDY